MPSVFWVFLIFIKLVVDLLVSLVGMFGIVTLKVSFCSCAIPGKFSASDTGRGVIKLLPSRSADISVCERVIEWRDPGRSCCIQHSQKVLLSSCFSFLNTVFFRIKLGFNFSLLFNLNTRLEGTYFV